MLWGFQKLLLLAVSTWDFFFKTLSLLYLDQEQRVKSVMIGRLSPGDSFGEITVLKGLPMPCSVITDTHVQIGTISTLDVHGRYFDTSSPPSQPSPDQLSPLPSSLPLIRRLSLRFTVFLDLFHTRRFWHCWFWHCAGCVSPLNRVLAWFTIESLWLCSTVSVREIRRSGAQFLVGYSDLFSFFVPRLLQSNYIFPHSKTELKIYDLSYSIYKLNNF